MIGRRVLCYLAVLLMSIVSLSIQADDDPTLIRIGSYSNAPKIYSANEGTVPGFCPNLVNFIAAQEGWRESSNCTSIDHSN